VNEVVFSSASQEWETPAALFAALDAEFGFDLDAAATDENAKCPRYFTKATDALRQRWEGVVFLNPPYGHQVGRWVRKAHEEAQRGATVSMDRIIDPSTVRDHRVGGARGHDPAQPRQVALILGGAA
jgi:phage N-6-adenine-methyltransferase